MRFTDVNHASDRLVGGYVFYKDSLCIVQTILTSRQDDVGDDFKVIIEDMKNSSKYSVWLSDSELNYMSIPLGYVNLELGKLTSYITRPPLRQYRQALTHRCIETSTTLSSPEFDHGYIDWSDIFRYTNSCLIDCITNNYPTYSEIMEEGGTGAFTRNLAVSMGTIYFCGSSVVADKGVLTPEFEYMKDELENVHGITLKSSSEA